MRTENRMSSAGETTEPPDPQSYIALVRVDGEKFWFFYDEIDEQTEYLLLQTLCAMSEDHDSSFSWNDAGAVAMVLRKLAGEHRRKVHETNVLSNC